MSIPQTRVTLLIAAGLLALSGCGNTPDTGEEPPEQAEGAELVEGGEESQETDEAASSAPDEALSDRSLLIPALEGALKKHNASAAWDGDVLTMTLDGDVEDETQRFQHCRVVGHFLEEGEALILAFPNGSIDCADIPELEGQLIW